MDELYEICEICGNAKCNDSGFCDKCEAELQEITTAYYHADEEVQRYFFHKIEEDY